MSLNKELALVHVQEPIAAPLHTYQDEKEISIHDLFRILTRRKSILLGTVFLFFVTAILVCVFSTRRYEASAQVQVENEGASSSALGLEGAAGQQGVSPDAMEDSLTLQTQAKILESDTLALKVIKDLNLEPTEDFQPKFNPIGWAMSFFESEGASDPPNASLDEAPKRRYQVLDVFGRNLTVKPVPGTRLINISYLNPDPKLAASIVNELTKGLIDYNFQTRHNATAKTADWLAGQLSDLRKQSEELQDKVAQAQRDSGVFTLGGSDSLGREQLYSTVLDKLQQATTAFSQAESSRIAKGAVYQAARNGDAEAISGLTGGITNGTTGLDNALTLIQKLREDLTNTKGQLAELSAKFGPAYPKLAELRAQQDAFEGSIKVEVERLAERAKNDYDVALGVEDATRKEYLEAKHQADLLNDKTTQYTILRQEAEESRTLYETLFKQLKQAGVLADFHSNDISIVDPARAPAKPAKPKKVLWILGSIACGLFLGTCAAVARDKTDRKIQNMSELEAQLGAIPLGVLPFQKQERVKLPEPARRGSLPAAGAARLSPKTIGGGLYSVDEMPSSELPLDPSKGKVLAVNSPHSPYVEAVRALRTSLLLTRSGSPPKVILVTSSIAGEGKSMLSLNLSVLLAQQNKKVLLVDGDLRRPTLHRSLHLGNEEGLSTFLTGQGEELDAMSSILQDRDTPDLFVLPAGPVPPYPAELLDSDQMRNGISVWRDHFDFVVIDGAPVLPVTDSVVLSTMVDFTLLLARYKMTERQSLDRSYRMLQAQTSRQKVGVVLNAVSQDADAYYQYYGYRDSMYYRNEGVSHEVA
jgi:capsular exopolysaccharide synthesis family protein